MDYRKYSAEDLALDEKFQKWVLNPDEEVVFFWEKWVSENPQHKPHISRAIELVKTAGFGGDPKLNEAYLAVWGNLNKNILQTKNVGKNRVLWYAKIAAAFLVLLVSSIILWNQFKGEDALEYRTAFGEIKEFVLEDGSKVTLNSNSLLKLTGGWSDGAAREVFLEGEAFFEIVKTEDHKSFEVNTKDKVHVQVLGTEFNVSTRRDKVEVYLQSGRVRVNSLVGEATLKPGDFVVYQESDQKLVIKQGGLTESPNMPSWKDNYFIFNDTPLFEIVQELEDNYGFSITMENKALHQRKITTRISRKDVNVLLKVLSETLDIKIEHDGNHLTFTDR